MYSFLPGLRGQLISVTSPRRTAWSILVPRARDPSGLCQGSRALASQRSNDCCALPVTSGHFPVSSHKISTVNLLHSSHLGTKPNHSASTNVLLPSFTAWATGFFIWKSSPREADDNNYSDKNTRFHVSLRTRKFALSNARGLSMRTHLTAAEALAWSNTGSPWFTDLPSNLANLIRWEYETNAQIGSRSLPQARRVVGSGNENGLA